MRKPKTAYMVHALAFLCTRGAQLPGVLFESTGSKLSFFVKSKKHTYCLYPCTPYILISLFPLITLRTIFLRALISPTALTLVSIPLICALFLCFVIFPVLSYIPSSTSSSRTPLLRCAILGLVAAFTWLTTAYIVDSALSQCILMPAPLNALIEGTNAKTSEERNIIQGFIGYRRLLESQDQKFQFMF